MASAALVPLVVCFSNGLRPTAAPRLRVTMMSSRPSLWDAYGPEPAGDGGAFGGSDTEGTRDSSQEVTWSIRGRDGPANTPVGYAEMLADAPAGTKVTNAGDSLRTIGLLGLTLALGVGFFALTGNSPVLDSLAAYAADDNLSADLAPSFSLIFLSEIGDKTFSNPSPTFTLAFTLTLTLTLIPT